MRQQLVDAALRLRRQAREHILQIGVRIVPVCCQPRGLDTAELRRAVKATFDWRKLAMPAALPSGLSDAFVQDAAKQRQWDAFPKKNRLEALDLAKVVAPLRGEFQKLATP